MNKIAPQNPDGEDNEVLQLIADAENSSKETHFIKREFRDIEDHVSPGLLDELSAAGDVLEQMSWKIGWLTERMYRELQANKRPKNYELVCYYVAASRLRHQRSKNAVKKWALTARFYTPDQADKYHADLLPFNHFTYAATFGDMVNPQNSKKMMWQSILEYSYYTYTGSGTGRPCSVIELREYAAKLFGETPKPAPVRSGTMSLTEITPFPYTGIEPIDEEDAEDLVVNQFVHALRVVANSLPYMARKYPKAAQVLSGITIQLNRLTKRIENGEDVEEEA